MTQPWVPRISKTIQLIIIYQRDWKVSTIIQDHPRAIPATKGNSAASKEEKTQASAGLFDAKEKNPAGQLSFCLGEYGLMYKLIPKTYSTTQIDDLSRFFL